MRQISLMSGCDKIFLMFINNKLINNYYIMKQEGFIKYIVIIIVILIVAFLSQQSYFKGYGKSFSETASGTFMGYWAKGSDWVRANIYPKIGFEVEKRGEIITNEVNQQKEKISESVGEKIKNYFSGIVDSVFHPSSTSSSSSSSSGQSCSPAQ
jgi:hypothetical protein